MLLATLLSCFVEEQETRTAVAVKMCLLVSKKQAAGVLLEKRGGRDVEDTDAAIVEAASDRVLGRVVCDSARAPARHFKLDKLADGVKAKERGMRRRRNVREWGRRGGSVPRAPEMATRQAPKRGWNRRKRL